MPATVTLKDVATEAGIHPSAVSRVLRGKDQALRLSDRRRQEIKDAAERLGYRPNSAAAATVSGKHNCISLVCGTGAQTSTLMQGLVYGLAEGLADRDMQLVVTRLSDEALTDEAQLPLFLRKHSCDGILLNYTHHVPAGIRDIIEKYRIPSVWLNVKQAHDCVHPDDFAAGSNATRWLLARGHERISYYEYVVTRSGDDAHYSMADRREGYVAAMREAGRTPVVVYLDGEPTGPGPVAKLRDLLQRPDRPTAAVGYGGEVDMACMAALSLGLRVPHDLDLVRFKESVARFGHVALPTLRIPHATLGHAAVAAVARKVANPAAKLPPVAVPFQDDVPTIDDHTGSEAPARTPL